MTDRRAEPQPSRTAIIVQARMTSTRLPGKVLTPVLGRPLLEFQIARLRRVERAGVIVVATTTRPTDDAVAELARRLGCGIYRGSEDDVLGRYAAAAEAFDADCIVRVTADCPLIDPRIVDRVLDRFAAGGCDYASNTIERTDPRGLDVEVIGRAALETAAREASEAADREHVTRYLYRRPERFALCSVRGEHDDSAHRWTVDEPADLELVRRILEALWPVDPGFSAADVLHLLARHPAWARINAGVEQRTADHVAQTDRAPHPA